MCEQHVRSRIRMCRASTSIRSGTQVTTPCTYTTCSIEIRGPGTGTRDIKCKNITETESRVAVVIKPPPLIRRFRIDTAGPLRGSSSPFLALGAGEG